MMRYRTKKVQCLSCGVVMLHRGGAVAAMPVLCGISATDGMLRVRARLRRVARAACRSALSRHRAHGKVRCVLSSGLAISKEGGMMEQTTAPAAGS
jgi:hypothetical protein